MHEVHTTLVLHTEHIQMISLTEKEVLQMDCGVLVLWEGEDMRREVEAVVKLSSFLTVWDSGGADTLEEC